MLFHAGKIVKGSDNFQKEKLIWPEGYTAVRKFPSITGKQLFRLSKLLHFPCIKPDSNFLPFGLQIQVSVAYIRWK